MGFKSTKSFPIHVDDETEKLIKEEEDLLPKFVKAPETKKVFKDKEARFEATVESSSKYSVAWKVNEVELTAKAGIKIERDFKANKFALVVSKASPNFGKKIVCEVTNEHGAVSKTCELIILGKSVFSDWFCGLCGLLF